MLKVLVAPLDWGLGHATRCIPIIKGLVNQRCTVIIAACGAQKAVLQEEFPDLSFVEIPGFRLKYGKNRAFTLLKIIFTIPKILIGIKRESRWLGRFAGREGLDLVISDNRYGLYGGGVVSVFITHQLVIRSSFGGIVDGLLRRINYACIRRFSVCWVPDVEGADNLGGALSHPVQMPRFPVRYIGWLSRLGMVEAPAGEPGLGAEEAIDLLVLLSGPEPQRSILERLLLGQLGEMEVGAATGAVVGGAAGKVVLVRGLPRGGGEVRAPAGVTVFDYLGTRELERVIYQSRLVLARSGYSTIMDLVRLQRRAVYIPTPGQPEQEYLGRYMEERGLAICRQQRGFVLREALEAAERLETRRPVSRDTVLPGEIGEVLAMARARKGERVP
jgi:UDP-N-acetylglucosamine transferase subunit ALG13